MVTISGPLVSHTWRGRCKASIQIGTTFFDAPRQPRISAGSPVIRYLGLFLTHAALAPATNQMSSRKAASSAPCFSMRCFVPETIPPTERTRVVREAHRGAYDRETIYKILDEGYVCHVGFAAN